MIALNRRSMLIPDMPELKAGDYVRYTKGMTRSEILKSVLALPMDERIQLVEDVWESIAETPDAITLTDEQRQELDRRLDARARGDWNGSPWEVVKQRITRNGA